MNPLEQTIIYSRLWPELTLFGIVLLLIVFDLLGLKIKQMTKGYLVLIGVLIAGVLSVVVKLGSVDGNHYLYDSSSKFFNILFLLGAFLTIAIDMSFQSSHSRSSDCKYPLWLLSVISLMFLSMSSSLISLYLSLEFCSIPLILLVTLQDDSKDFSQVAQKFFLIMAFSSLLVIFGFSFLYGLSGAVNLLTMKLQIAVVHITQRQIGVIILLSIVAILGGLMFKSGLIPFGNWLKDFYRTWPIPIGAFFAVAFISGILLAFAKVFINGLFAFHGPEMNPNDWGRLVAFVAFVNIVLGTIQLLRQKEFMTMIYYSIIVQIGFVLTGMVSMNVNGLQSAGFYFFTCLFALFGVFAVQGLLRQNSSVILLDELKGLSKSSLLVSILLVVYVMSIAGLPLLAGFVAKYTTIDAALETASKDKLYHWLYLLIGAVVFSSAVIFFRFTQLCISLFGKPDRPPVVIPIPFPIKMVLAVTAIGTLLFGIFPGKLLSFAAQLPQAFGFMIE